MISPVPPTELGGTSPLEPGPGVRSWRGRIPSTDELRATALAWLRALPVRAVAARWAALGTGVLWLPLVGYFLANRPGFMTYDSFDVWRQATTGHWEDTHTLAYVWAMKASELIVGTPTALTFAQTVFMAFGLGMIARALVRLGTQPHATYLLVGFLACTPMVAGFTITLWKDIPYAAAMLCVAARVVDLFEARLHRPDEPIPNHVLRSLFGWGLVALLFRQNGVFFTTYLGALLLIVASRRRREVLGGTVALAVFFVFLKFALYPAVGVEKTPDEINIAGFVHDINAALSHNPDLFTKDDLDLLSRAMPLSEWKLSYENPYGCYAIIPWYLNPTMRLTEFRGHTAEYERLWLKIAIHAPGTVIRSRLCVASLAWRPDNVGYLYTLSYGQPHENGIAGNPYGFETRPVIAAWRPQTVRWLAWADRPDRQWYTWRAPTWIYVVYALTLLQAVRFRRLAWLIPGAVLLAQQLNVITLNPSQDARYMFGAYMTACALVALLFYLPPLDDLVDTEDSEESSADDPTSPPGC